MKQQRGFSLFELVMVILIMGVISVVVGKTLYQAAQTFMVQKNISETDWQGFIALERLTTDIHNIRSASSIATITSTQFSFVDADGSTVTYSKSGNSLLRSGQTLATGISGLTFSYFNNTGASTSTADQVRYVNISLILNQGTMNSSLSTLIGTRGLA